MGFDTRTPAPHGQDTDFASLDNAVPSDAGDVRRDPHAPDAIPELGTQHTEGADDEERSQAYAEAYELGLAEGMTEGRSAGYKAGYDTGYEAGLLDGRDKGGAQAHAEITRLKALSDACTAALDKLEHEVGEALVNLAVHIARHLVRNTLTIDRKAILDIVGEILAAHEGQQALLTLRMHPDDAELVRRHLNDTLSTGSWKLLADESVEAGGCLASSVFGEVDATLSTRWELVLSSLDHSLDATEAMPHDRRAPMPHENCR